MSERMPCGLPAAHVYRMIEDVRAIRERMIELSELEARLEVVEARLGIPDGPGPRGLRLVDDDEKGA